MATKLSIVNLALTRIGVARLTSLTDGTVQQLDVTAVWDTVLGEVLEARDWVFAKSRATLSRAVEVPIHGYEYYYILPKDFLRFPKGTRTDPSVYPVGLSGSEISHSADQQLANILSKYSWKVETIPLETGLEKVTNGLFTGVATGWTLGTNWAYGTNNVAKVVSTSITTMSQAVATMATPPVADELYSVEFHLDAIAGGALIPSIGGTAGDPVYLLGTTKQYIIAANATGDLTFTPTNMLTTCTIDSVSVFKVEDRLVLLSDYEDSEDDPLQITYIKKIVDPTYWSSNFISALAFRLAAELAIPRTEGTSKYGAMMEQYEFALTKADSINSSHDYLEDELGSDSWIKAGR